MLTVTTKHGQGTIYSFWCKIRCASINCCAVKNKNQNLKTKPCGKMCVPGHTKTSRHPFFCTCFLRFFNLVVSLEVHFAWQAWNVQYQNVPHWLEIKIDDSFEFWDNKTLKFRTSIVGISLRVIRNAIWI